MSCKCAGYVGSGEQPSLHFLAGYADLFRSPASEDEGREGREKNGGEEKRRGEEREGGRKGEGEERRWRSRMSGRGVSVQSFWYQGDMK